MSRAAGSARRCALGTKGSPVQRRRPGCLPVSRPDAGAEHAAASVACVQEQQRVAPERECCVSRIGALGVKPPRVLLPGECASDWRAITSPGFRATRERYGASPKAAQLGGSDRSRRPVRARRGAICRSCRGTTKRSRAPRRAVRGWRAAFAWARERAPTALARSRRKPVAGSALVRPGEGRGWSWPSPCHAARYGRRAYIASCA